MTQEPKDTRDYLVENSTGIQRFLNDEIASAQPRVPAPSRMRPVALAAIAMLSVSIVGVTFFGGSPTDGSPQSFQPGATDTELDAEARERAKRWRQLGIRTPLRERYDELKELLSQPRERDDSEWRQRARSELERWPLNEIRLEPAAVASLVSSILNLIERLADPEYLDFVVWAADMHHNVFVQNLANHVHDRLTAPGGAGSPDGDSDGSRRDGNIR